MLIKNEILDLDQTPHMVTGKLTTEEAFILAQAKYGQGTLKEKSEPTRL
jgi:hypothetical protein